jgi:hypothetical protein
VLSATTGSSHNRPGAGTSIVPGTRGVATAKYRTTKSGVHVQVRILSPLVSTFPFSFLLGLVSVPRCNHDYFLKPALYILTSFFPRLRDIDAARTQMETFTHAEDSQNELFHKAKAESETDGEDNHIAEAKGQL